MNLEIRLKRLEDSSASGSARQIVFLTAVFATVLGLLYLLGLIGKLIVDGSVHSVSSQPVQLVSAVVAILLDLALLILFVGLRWEIPAHRAVYADLAVVFMTLVCATSSINWFVQLAVVPRLAQAEPALRALVDVHSDGSVMYAIEHLGWGIFYGLATIFMAVALSPEKLGNWVRALLFAGGALSLVHVLGVIATTPLISDLGYLAWGLLLPATTALLAVQFRRS